MRLNWNARPFIPFTPQLQTNGEKVAFSLQETRRIKLLRSWAKACAPASGMPRTWAWKLERVLRQGSPDQLLDTYQSERSPHVREYINLTIELGQVINHTALSLIRGNPTDLGGGKQKISQLRPILGPRPICRRFLTARPDVSAICTE